VPDRVHFISNRLEEVFGGGYPLCCGTLSVERRLVLNQYVYWERSGKRMRKDRCMATACMAMKPGLSGGAGSGLLFHLL
jgi:hypothetical protein